MIAGHFGFAAAVKSRETTAPLWALMLAAAWLDVLFVPLLLAGIETLEPLPGTTDGYGGAIIHADYTHSLLGALILSALFGLVASRPFGRRVGAVLGGVVFSHWILDLVVHRGDMPLLPGNLGDLPLLGFGLWQVPLASIGVELALVLIGTYLYWRAATRTAAGSGAAAQRNAVLATGALFAAGIFTLALSVLGI